MSILKFFKRNKKKEAKLTMYVKEYAEKIAYDESLSPEERMSKVLRAYNNYFITSDEELTQEGVPCLLNVAKKKQSEHKELEFGAIAEEIFINSYGDLMKILFKLSTLMNRNLSGLKKEDRDLFAQMNYYLLTEQDKQEILEAYLNDNVGPYINLESGKYKYSNFCAYLSVYNQSRASQPE